ncbi:lysosomal alpha-mannosidase-like isoform X2 [Dermacentor albipictus]|uniref:lysosomal alpha-mannosidase-like isoform X2 n=1 Tax=Dermacentor albipictus TaxID=60249 RepID=UPI0031FCDDF1
MRPVAIFACSLVLLFHNCPAMSAGNKCELKGCPKPRFGHINVHVLCHSHNDAGWLRSVDSIYNDTVSSIYDTVLQALGENRRRRYVSAENVFFSRWWKDQSKAIRRRVHNLVQSGRLQFVGGGWVQNDEAVTHYTAIIDQMTLGLRFLNETFGSDCGVPSVAWQADPFGHSVAQASLFAKMGFSGMMTGRVSMDTLEQWKASQHMGFVWKTAASTNGSTVAANPAPTGHTNPGEGGELFTWVPWKSYSTPAELCFDACNYAEPMQDYRYWGHEVLLKHAQQLEKEYGGKTVPLMMGDDLTWFNAVEHYRDADNLLSRANRVGRWPMNLMRWLFRGIKLKPVNVIYSTPACFLEALHSDKSRSWPLFEDDLVPYTDRPKHTWTGFYTTRPGLKMMSRYANGFLQACKQLSVLGAQEQVTKVRDLQEAVALMQHHDAITGTSVSRVASDYAAILSRGIAKCEEVLSSALSTLSMGTVPLRSLRGRQQVFGFCHHLNESHCPHSEDESEFTVIVYNPASVGVSPYIRLPVDTNRSSSFTVTGPGGIPVESQVVQLPQHPESRGVEAFTNATAALLFQALVKPLGFSVYRVASANEPTASTATNSFLELDRPAAFIENKRYRIELDPASGLVSRILVLPSSKRGTSSRSSTPVLLRQTFASYDKDQADSSVPSPGHYVFSAHREAQTLGDHVAYRVVKGPLVQEIHQIFNDYISQAVTLHRDSNFIEFSWTVGPPPSMYAPYVGQDVIVRYESDMDTEGFYTDGNGWRNMHRVVTTQEDKLPIPSNYYPVVSWIYVQDTRRDLTMAVLPDRPQGGSSLKKGHVELMVHRWHATSDDLGNPESPWEPTMTQQKFMASGTHRVFLGTAAETQRLLRPQALQLVYRPLVAFAPAQWKPYKEEFSGLRSTLPSTVHLLTLEALSRTQVLLRLEHLVIDQHAVQVNVTRLLRGFRLNDVRPVTLAANQFLPGPTRLKWRVRGQPGPTTTTDHLAMPAITEQKGTSDTLVTLSPGQIVSLIAKIGEREPSR